MLPVTIATAADAWIAPPLNSAAAPDAPFAMRG
jgi:hypothetical protein